MNKVIQDRWSKKGLIISNHDQCSGLSGKSYQQKTQEILNKKVRFQWVFHPIKVMKRKLKSLLQ